MSESDYVDTAIEAEVAWKHAEEHHWADQTDNDSLLIDYLRVIAAELRAARHAKDAAA